MPESTPRWYQEAIIYELHIRAFFDGNDDGNGDFRGLVRKLDYLHDLGITAIWLLPFYPSPLKDDGYDIANYTQVHSNYGSLSDFRLLLREAHRRNIRIITELVINHTSDQHPWFQRARHAKPDSNWRNFYVWSDTDERYKEARIIFKDFETSNWTWDPVAQAYYWHRFYSHQPDLNFANPAVHKALFAVVDFWLGMGVDGLRLDAVPYLYESEGTNCENLPETHAFLKKLRAHIDAKFPDRMLLAEANQWPEDAVRYFGAGDECHMAFHFPLMPRMFMALRMEDRFPIIDILQQTPALPPTCQWSIFLRNHDELTLEMVTDEERDYMYRVYAHDPQARINLGIRRRLAPLLSNNRRKIELLNGLLFSLPGTPVLYYGDEIGMGDNYYLGDRNAVRMPMQWSPDRNAGFSRAHPHRLYLPTNIDPEYHYESVNVATQQNNPESLLWWTKKLIALRKRYTAFALGTLHFLLPDNSKVLAFVTAYRDECILVVVNLSRFPECVGLDLSPWQGMGLLELFGQSNFPPIGANPYFFTLSAHTFYWFLLQPPTAQPSTWTSKEQQLPLIDWNDGWEALRKNMSRAPLEHILANYITKQRWFAAKNQAIKDVTITDIIPIAHATKSSYLLLVAVVDRNDERELYSLPVTVLSGDALAALQERYPTAVIARFSGQQACLIDGYYDANLVRALLKALVRNGKYKGGRGTLALQRGSNFSKPESINAEITPLKAEQSNTSIICGKQLLLKAYRRCATGINPESEMTRFLTEHAHFPHTPHWLGDIVYEDSEDSGEKISLGIVQAFIPHEIDAWQYTLNSINRFFEHILSAHPTSSAEQLPPLITSYSMAKTTLIPAHVQTLLGDYGISAHLMGQRTAQLHHALTSNQQNTAFAPEPVTTLYQRSLYQAVRGLWNRTVGQLRHALPQLPANTQPIVERVLQATPAIERLLQPMLTRKLGGMRIRCHGDLHLGQLLYTGKDFLIIDFEGEPARPLSERRIKRPALRDVAGMLRSFHYAAQTALYGDNTLIRAEDVGTLAPWADFWRRWVSVYFLQGYLQDAAQHDFLPHNPADFALLLPIMLAEKAIYEILYELNNRPNWITIPCAGLLELVES